MISFEQFDSFMVYLCIQVMLNKICSEVGGNSAVCRFIDLTTF